MAPSNEHINQPALTIKNAWPHDVSFFKEKLKVITRPIDEVIKIKGLIERRFIVVESIITELSPALGVHTGPGTAGLCYFPVGKISQSLS